SEVKKMHLTTTKNALTVPGRLDQNPAAVYLARLSPGGRRTMNQALNVIADLIATGSNCLEVPWQDLRYQHTAAIRSLLIDMYAYATVNKMLAALRGTLKAAWKLGLMDAADYHAAASVENVRGSRLPTGRALTRPEISQLLGTCDHDFLGKRDVAIITTLYGCGLRRAELVNLQLSDYDQINQELIVTGKRNKQRMMPVPDGTAVSLTRWLQFRGDAPGPLFTKEGGGSLTSQAIYEMLRKRGRMAHVAEFSPHDFRRTFISNLLNSGADIVTVQKLAGHASVETTALYDRRGDKVKREAVARLDIPS
ncbi:MAG: tyrosine-type recombinase/integrase, partial [Anaerolineales bacterium]|nr:tyrosine-type recombinase/integrase [Anaerolineales bacterium]